MSAKDFTSFKMPKWGRPKQLGPELVAKNIPKDFSNFKEIKNRAHKCNRCGEYFITDVTTQSYCATCRGWMGSITLENYKHTWNHGKIVTNLLEEMRR